MRKINLVFVPSKLTWMLQPLDVAVFSSLKRAYHRRVLDMRMANAGAVPDGAWVPCLAGSVSEVVLGRPWRELLSKCGCLGLEGLQSLIAQQVAGTEVPRAPPGLEDLQTLLGKGSAAAAAKLLDDLNHPSAVRRTVRLIPGYKARYELLP
jgi:hypothetical protein